MPLTGANLSLALLANSSAGLDLKTAVANLNFSRGSALDAGVGLNQADRIFDDTNTLAPSGTIDIDLAGDVNFKDAFGVAITFARIKGLLVAAAPANTNNVVVGGAPSNAWVGPFGAATHTIALPPNGLLALWAPTAAGWVVTAGTGDLLRIANSGAGTGVTYDIVIIGASA